MKITNLHFKRKNEYDHLLTASGFLDGRPFKAHQYEDAKGGQRGAAPTRWGVHWVEMPKGVRIAIARQLNARHK